MNILYFKTLPYAISPQRKHAQSAGCDLATPVDIILLPRENTIINTGIRLVLPVNTYAELKSRSSIYLQDKLICFNGVIDCDFQDSIRVILYNYGDSEILLEKGIRICQVLIHKIEIDSWQEISNTDNIPNSTRGLGKFGSTGKF